MLVLNVLMDLFFKFLRYYSKNTAFSFGRPSQLSYNAVGVIFKTNGICITHLECGVR